MWQDLQDQVLLSWVESKCKNRKKPYCRNSWVGLVIYCQPSFWIHWNRGNYVCCYHCRVWLVTLNACKYNPDFRCVELCGEFWIRVWALFRWHNNIPWLCMRVTSLSPLNGLDPLGRHSPYRCSRPTPDLWGTQVLLTSCRIGYVLPSCARRK